MTPQNASEIFEIISALKKIRRHLCNNSFLTEESVAKLIDSDAITYVYVPERWLWIGVAHELFTEVLFYGADMSYLDEVDAIPAELLSVQKTGVCELYGKGALDADCGIVAEWLLKNGYENVRNYARFSLRRKDAEIGGADVDKAYSFVEGFGENTIDNLFQYFDPFTDHLPNRTCNITASDESLSNCAENSIQKFLNEMKCIRICDGMQPTDIGELVYSVQGKVYTEEYVYVTDTARGRGISNLLHDYWLTMMPEDSRILRWVHEQNKASLGVNAHYGFVPDGRIKKVYIRK